MHIVGGIYRELCCRPAWDAVFGSGGRAAAAVSAFSPSSVLHAYAEDFDSNGVALLTKLGIDLRLSLRPTQIVFSYFHPLSRPHIQPPPDEINHQPKIVVSGDAVLRFGFLEGDAVVDSHRAVYDPQTWQNPLRFGENGSVAKELAIVLNELELRSATNLDDLQSAASNLMECQGAVVVVVKRGVRGAAVFERSGKSGLVPAYRSSRVFKIGTGDVFSAIFAYYWAEKKLPAAYAADIASRSVATYCSTRQLPLANAEIHHREPIKFMTPGSVLLEGAINTIGQRYTMEEARFILRELGVNVSCPKLGDASSGEETAALLIVDGFGVDASEFIIRAKDNETPVVVLQEAKNKIDHLHLANTNIEVIDDFSSALYFAAWAAAENAQ